MATITLRPSGGVAAGLGKQPSSGFNWDHVSEVSPDNEATYVYPSTSAGIYVSDLYSLPSSGLSGVWINSVNVYAVFGQNNLGGTGHGTIKIKENGVTTDSSPITIPASAPWTWAASNNVWTTKPSNGGFWTIADIDSMAIGISLERDVATGLVGCTQVYAVVTYSSYPTGPFPTFIQS